ncbi:hypothetical protein CPB86DRAFT_766168 [Serendipita vermifera]|nr:hypothetical protein CPB86DRAFT_766168 [Serendipita vermifera]
MDSTSRSNEQHHHQQEQEQEQHQHNRQKSTSTKRSSQNTNGTFFSPTRSYDSSTSTAVGAAHYGSDADHPIPIIPTTTSSTPSSTLHFTTSKTANHHHANALKVLTSNSPFPSANPENKERASAELAPFGFDSDVVGKKGERQVGGAGGDGKGGEEKKVVANGIGDPEKHQHHSQHSKEKRLSGKENGVPSSASDESTAVDALTLNNANEGGVPSNHGHDADVDSAEINDGRPLLLGKRLVVLIAGIICSSFIVALDQSIVSTAMPVISSQFKALAQLPWVVNGFYLTQATGTLTFGQLYTFLPAKHTFLFSILLFEIGSILSAVAPSFAVLVFGRAVTGLGAGGLVVGMHTIVGQVVRLEDRSMHYSSLGACFTLASFGGPLVGGAFTDKLSWRWCFWINLPFGAIGAIAIWFVLPAYKVRMPPSLAQKPLWRRWLALDWVGNIFALGMMVCLIVALQWGGYTLPWNDKVIILLFVLSGVLVILFLLWELYTARGNESGKGRWRWSTGNPMVPLSMLQNRSVQGASLTGFFLNSVWGALITYLPLLYQSRGHTALRSGIDILPFMVSSVVALVIAGVLVKRIGYYKPWMVLGPWVATIGVGCLTNSRLLKYEMIIGWQIIVGTGFGVAFQNTIMAIQAEYATQGHLIPQAASIVGFSQRTGPMIGAAIAGAIFINSLDHELSNMPSSISLTPDQIAHIRDSVQYVWAEEMSQAVTNEQRMQIVEVFVDSVRKAFIVGLPGCVLAGFSALLVRNWNVRKRSQSS